MEEFVSTPTKEDKLSRPMLLGIYIRRLREQKNLKMSDLANLAGIDKSILSRIERGQTRSLHQSNLEALAQALEVSPEFLRDLANRPATPPPPSVVKMMSRSAAKPRPDNLKDAMRLLIENIKSASTPSEQSHAKDLLLQVVEKLPDRSERDLSTNEKNKEATAQTLLKWAEESQKLLLTEMR